MAQSANPDTGASVRELLNTPNVRVKELSEVPDSERTPDKDTAAREIQQWIDEGRWPLSATEMSEIGEYSPQHYRNTLDAGYIVRVNGKEPANESGGVSEETVEDLTVALAEGTLDLPEPPSGVDRKSFYRGWFTCYLKHVHE